MGEFTNSSENNDIEPVSKFSMGTKIYTWRIYRILAGVLTLYIGLKASLLLIIIDLTGKSFGFLGGVMSGQGANYNSLMPGSGILIIAGIIALPFIIGGIYFCGKKGRGRTIVWIAALLIVPITLCSIYISYLIPGNLHANELSSVIIAVVICIYIIWVLIKTVSRKQTRPPSKRALLILAAILVVGFIGYLAWGYTMVKESDLIQNITMGRTNEVINLLEQGADANKRSQKGITALVHTLEIQHSSEMLIALLNNGADPSQTSKFMWPEQSLQLLLGGSEVYISPESMVWEHTPLILAIRGDYPKVAELMIEKGADVYAEKANESEEFPLILAINANRESSHLNLITALFNKGLTINSDILVQSHITYISSKEVIALLIEHGADVNAKPIELIGDTPLMWATKSWDTDKVQLLLDHGANLKQVSREYTPLQYVESSIKRAREDGWEIEEHWLAMQRILQKAARK